MTLLPSSCTFGAAWRRLRAGLLLLAALWLAASAQADLAVFPTRLVLEGKTRSAQLEVINNGQETATYRIHLVNKRMTETGSFEDVQQAAPGEQFADKLVRYSPRQVVLAPGAGQAVRLSVRLPAGLAAGEYRSHLLFERLPPDQGSSIENAATKPDEIGVQLRVLMGVSIPVIVRHGETAATVSLSGLELMKPEAGQPPALAFVLNRSGTRSVYGDLGVTFTPEGGEEQRVGLAGGVAVYTPNALRRVRIALQPPPGLALARGTLRVSYRERPDAGGKLLAEAVLPLP